MICSNCGTENPAGAKFCTECASRLAVVCANCGTANAPTAKFCAECASPLAATAAETVARGSPAAPVAATGPVAERRLVSVLFADLVGSTALADGRDPEETRELLSGYFELAREVIGRYGGTVEKFIGDAVMAVWGAPTAHEDDAIRAVRAGLELVDAVRSLGHGLQARAGVLTGEAAVTIGATNQGMVAGDLVNTASRLQSAAAPGAVLVGEATQRAASRAVAFEPAGEQALKGKTGPVAAWRAVRIIGDVGGRKHADVLEAPFVGRDDELRLVKDLYHATTRERRPRLVSVIGPAGIGKTRLAWEFLRYIDGLVETVWYHDGRSPAYGDGISFWALGEMVRRRAGLLETDDEATTRTKVAEMLATHVPDADERAWIEGALLALLGVEASAAPEQLFGAWRTFFERLTATAPVDLVFEDFHYADTGLIDFVDHLVEWSRGHAIYVLTLSRPELLERRPDWGAGKRSFVSLSLEPLPPEAMRELLAGLVPGLPDAAAAAIIARADGIPLYAVETVRMLVAEGRLVLEGDAYVPRGDLTALAVPETLTALIASRLDALAPADRALVQDAAVLGQSFTPAAVAAIAGTDEAAITPRLRALVRSEILAAQDDPRSPERGQYAFVQALIREVAYGTLAKADRKAKHLAAARFFESLGTDELAGALAGHYLAAHQHAQPGPEADALAGQARLALRGAADRASALGAPEQAVRFLEQALEVAPDAAQQADLLERLGEAAGRASRYEQADDAFRRATELHLERGDRPAAARAVAAQVQVGLDARRPTEARDLVEGAVSRFDDLAGSVDLVPLEAQRARAYFFLNDSRRALELIDGVLDAAERHDLRVVLADALVTRGSALCAMGRPREGLGVIAVGESLAREDGVTRILLRALNNTAVNSWHEDPARAIAAAQEGLALAQRVGDKGSMVLLSGGAAYGALQTLEWDRALALVEPVEHLDLSPGERIIVLSTPITIAALRGQDIRDRRAALEPFLAQMDAHEVRKSTLDLDAVVAFAAGDLVQATRLWREEIQVDDAEAKWVLPNVAHSALWQGDLDGARAILHDLDAAGLHATVTQLQRRAIEAGIAALEGETDAALASFRKAFDGLTDLGTRWEAALVAVDMATLLDPALPEVRDVAASAREGLDRAGARPIVARLDAALARPSGAQLPRRTGVAVVDRHAGVGQPLADEVGG
ncbi:MAG TPA: adenylate/guanylate cyclase domain-containing protein [Candidatus Sulfotelmatobacter sp.]|nr:adenylate/guanylate cyclase domain-containing protein [Candidatus Sulfotelmatobacter sp.]